MEADARGEEGRSRRGTARVKVEQQGPRRVWEAVRYPPTDGFFRLVSPLLSSSVSVKKPERERAPVTQRVQRSHGGGLPGARRTETVTDVPPLRRVRLCSPRPFVAETPWCPSSHAQVLRALGTAVSTLPAPSQT